MTDLRDLVGAFTQLRPDFVPSPELADHLASECPDKGYTVVARKGLLVARLCSCIERCQRCEGEGIVMGVGPEGHDIAGDCPECSAARDAAHWFTLATFPSKYAECRVGTYEPNTEEQREAQRAAVRIVRGTNEGRGLSLFGSKGAGKTGLLVGAGKALCDIGYRVRYTEWPTALERIKAAFDTFHDGAEMHVLCTVPVLILDEMTYGGKSEWALERLRDVISTRHRSELLTLVGGNARSEKDLERALGGDHLAEMIVSRLYDFAPPIFVTGHDRRRT